MNRVKGRAASGFRPKLQIRAESLSLECLDKKSGMSGKNRAKGRAASRFKPKMHNRDENLNVESLDIRSGKSGLESRQWSRRTRI